MAGRPSLHIGDVVNLTISNFNLSALERGFAWVGRFENFLELLKGLSSCLNEKEVNEGNFDADPDNVYQVQLPLNLFHTDRDTVRVDDHGNVEEEKVGSGSLGPSPVLKTLYGVQSLEWCPTPGEDDTEAVDGDDGAVGEVVSGLCGGSECGEEDVEEEGTCQTTKQHLATAKPVEEGGSVDGAEHTEDGVDSVDEQLLVGVGNTGVLNHGRHEVGYDVVAWRSSLAKFRQQIT